MADARAELEAAREEQRHSASEALNVLKLSLEAQASLLRCVESMSDDVHVTVSACLQFLRRGQHCHAVPGGAGKPVLETLEKRHSFHAPMRVCLSQLELHVSSSARTLTVYKHCEVGKIACSSHGQHLHAVAALLLLHQN